MHIKNRLNSQNYSKTDLTRELGKLNTRLVKQTIQSLYPRHFVSTLDQNQMMRVYAHILMVKPELIPQDIEPRSDVRSLKLLIGQKTIKDLKDKVLHLYFEDPATLKAKQRLTLVQLRS